MPMRQAGGWHGGKVLPPRGKTAPVTGPAGRDEPNRVQAASTEDS